MEPFRFQATMTSEGIFFHNTANKLTSILRAGGNSTRGVQLSQLSQSSCSCHLCFSAQHLEIWELTRTEQVTGGHPTLVPIFHDKMHKKRGDECGNTIKVNLVNQSPFYENQCCGSHSSARLLSSPVLLQRKNRGSPGAPPDGPSWCRPGPERDMEQ